MSRVARFYSTLFSVMLALGIYFMILAISHDNKHDFDLTKDKRHTLSQQTQQLVQGLAKPVKLTVFSASGRNDETEKLLERYRNLNPDGFTYDLLDLVRNPLKAEELGVTQPNQGVFELVGSDPPRRERVMSMDENGVTNALMKLTRSEEKTLYFLTGHGERSLDDTQSKGVQQLKNSLGAEGFVSKSLNLSTEQSVPEDAAALVIVGPTSALLPVEKPALQAYLDGGGDVLLLLELDTHQDFVELATNYGFKLPSEAIIDKGSALVGAEPVFATGLPVPGHIINKDFGINTFFMLARPVQRVQEGDSADKVKDLIVTQKSAFTVPIESVLGQSELALNPDEIKDEAINLAAVAEFEVQGEVEPEPSPTPDDSPTPAETPNEQDELPKKTTRVVVVGDADFLSNGYLGAAGNRDFAMNCVNWLAESEDQIALRKEDEQSKPLILEESQTRILTFLLQYLIPFAMAAIGVMTGVHRRNLK